MRRLRRYLAALPALVFGLGAGPAFAAVINAAGFTVGQNSANFTGATVQATGGNFTKVTSVGTGATEVVGVSTGFVATEVDRDGESITINFGGSGATVSEVVIGLLFKQGEWGGADDEQMRLRPNTGSCNTLNCLLSADGTFMNVTTGVTELSPGEEGQGGIFRIANPFGSTAITELVLTPFDVGGTGGANSDFGLISVTYTLVPEPTTLVLVGLGLVALSLMARRRGPRWDSPLLPS
jgi:hypothetical protein